MKRFQYAKWLRRLWLRGACSKASRQPRTALAFESLEERTVPSILFSSTGSRTITDSGGPILQSMQVDLIFWGSGWNSGNGPTERTNVRATMNNILNSTYFDGMGQYRGIGHGTFFREDLITTSSPGSTFQTAANGDLATMVANNINNNTLPSPNGRILYFVVPQPGSTPSDCGGCGGRHLAGIASNNRVFPYGLVTNPNNISVDQLSLLMSHELVEAATDPEWNITIGGRNQAAFVGPGGPGDEIADGEPNNNEYAMRLNGSLVQAYLSQRDHAYIVTNGSTNTFTVSSAGILSFQTLFGGNSIEINRVNNGVFATLNNSTAQFEPSSNRLVFSIRGIQVNALSSDSISIDATGADAPVTVNLGSGTESVGVGNGVNGLGGIQGSINVRGGTGTDFLDLFDTAAPSSSNLTYTLTASSVTRSGIVPISFSGQSHLSLNLGGSRGADIYNVSSTQAGSTTTITAGAGNATVNVEAASGSLTVNLAGSNNRVNVAPTSHNLDRILGAIAVHGTGSTSLTVNDSSKAFISPGPPGAYFVTGSSIQRALTAAISYQSLSQVTLDTGVDVAARPVQVSVTGTAAGATTSVVALGGLNLIDVEDAGHTLNGLRGDLSVTGAGVTQLFVVDSGERFPTFQVGTYTVTGNSVQRAGTGAVRYTGVSIINVSTGAYVNVNPPLPILITVTGTSAASTTVTAQPTIIPNQITVGDSARTLNGIRGALALNGANFSQLTVDDHGTGTGGNSYTLANNSVSRAGSPAVAISYNGMITTTVNAANAANTIEVTGTAGAQAVTLDAGAGGDTVNVRATSAPLGVTFHNASNQVAVGSTANALAGIQGAVSLTGSLVGTALTVHDEGTTSARTYTVTNTTIGWGGPVSLTYSNLTSIMLNGGSGGDTFTVPSLSSGTTLTLTGGSGSNTLIGSNAGNSWEVTAPDTGLLSGPAYPSPVSFQQVGNLTAGNGGDYFLIDDQEWISGNLTGGGSDTLDFSPYSTLVEVDLQIGIATGVGGSVSGITTVIGGNGNGTQAENLLIGNGGDTLIGGFGRSNILVAGGSGSTLIGGDSNDLLIGGTTAYDTDPALAAWGLIADYWAGTDGNTDDYATRVANLMTGNGVPLLDATTVTGNGGGNTLTGTGELALIYSDGNDNITGFDPNSIVVPITP
jgi:hypothetical protein